VGWDRLWFRASVCPTCRPTGIGFCLAVSELFPWWLDFDVQSKASAIRTIQNKQYVRFNTCPDAANAL
jgi:hypothetical protein